MTTLPDTMSADEAVAALFFSDAGIDDPTPYYHHLRRIAPVHHSATGAVFLSRYADCREVLRDSRFGKATRDGESEGLIPSSDPAAAEFRRELLQRRRGDRRPLSLLFLNPPEHTRQRGLVSRAFTPRRVEEMRARIATLADGVVGRFVEAGGGDLLEAIAFPLPVAVIGAMVGVPEADWPPFRSLITAAAAGIEAGATVDELRAAEAANDEVWAYFVDLVAERHAHPRDDLLSDLIAVNDGGDTLSDGEIIVVAMLLFAAGFETTTNLIGNGLFALLSHPDELQRLRADSSLMPSAIWELLRWDSPVQLNVRAALRDVEILGESVGYGQIYTVLQGSGNRDEAAYPVADGLDVGRFVDRSTPPPLSFGWGPHHCLGAALARAEGEIVFGGLLDRFASLELLEAPSFRSSFTLRGLTSLNVACRSR